MHRLRQKKVQRAEVKIVRVPFRWMALRKDVTVDEMAYLDSANLVRRCERCGAKRS